jgi:hypothetical protein
MLDQIFLPLCDGGAVQMAELMVRESVTVTQIVPSEYLMLLNYGQNIL